MTGSLSAEALKASFDAANSYSETSVVAVIIGVVIEFLALFIFSKEMPLPEKVVMAFATFVIAVGCGGEWLFGGRATSDARQLQNIAEMSTAEAQKDAASANERAGRTNERAAKLEVDAAPRDVHLPKTFIPAFAAIQKRRVVKVSSYASDAEGGRLATEIIGRLRDMHFVVQDDSLTHQALKPMAFGVQVTGSDGGLVAVLMSWLDESDLFRPAPPVIPGSSIAIGYGQVPNQEPPDATIFVGSKPLPKGS